jgi:hypothetical protein
MKFEEYVKENRPEALLVPKSVFKPVSEFYDSGIGDSLPTHSSYAATIASHSSFVSSNGAHKAGTLRVPPMPAAVGHGEPFDCEICGQRLRHIKNRVDWKYDGPFT